MVGTLSFTGLVDAIYGLPFDERIEIKNLLAHNIAASRRSELLESCKEAKAEYRSGGLAFSSSVNELKKML